MADPSPPTGRPPRSETVSRHHHHHHHHGQRRRTYTEESVERRYSKANEERTTENNMERSEPTRLEKCRAESGRGDGHGDVEKEDMQS